MYINESRYSFNKQKYLNSYNDSTGSGRMSTPPSHIKRKTVILDRYMVHGKDI